MESENMKSEKHGIIEAFRAIDEWHKTGKADGKAFPQIDPSDEATAFWESDKARECDPYLATYMPIHGLSDRSVCLGFRDGMISFLDIMEYRPHLLEPGQPLAYVNDPDMSFPTFFEYSLMEGDGSSDRATPFRQESAFTPYQCDLAAWQAQMQGIAYMDAPAINSPLLPHMYSSFENLN